MDKEDLKRMGEDPDFIPGIYNYCDRWCERCPFTARCMNFAVGEEQFPNQTERDISNAAFWEKMHGTFQATFDLIAEMAEEAGIDLDALDVEDEMSEHEQRRTSARNHPLARAAGAYTAQVDAWFESAHDRFQAREDDLNRTMCLGLADARPEEEAALLPILVHLERLRRNVEAAFPGARAFVRPGFGGVPREEEC